MIRTVLFDLDGTLLDSEPDFTSILNDMLADSGRHVNEEDMRRTVSSGARAMVSLAYGLSPDHESFDGYLTRFLDFYEARIPETRAGLYDGVEELLTHLEECGMNWGIVTNKSSRFTLPLLKQFPVLNTTEIVVCADHVTLPKPDPEGLIKACDLGQCQTSEAVYVGDHPRDIEAARNAGMKSVAVSWGYLPESPPLSHWQADSIAEHCDALLNILKTL